MGTRYPGRPKDLNMTRQIVVRLIDSQYDRLTKVAEFYKMSHSAIIREALTSWLNTNSTKGIKKEG